MQDGHLLKSVPGEPQLPRPSHGLSVASELGFPSFKCGIRDRNDSAGCQQISRMELSDRAETSRSLALGRNDKELQAGEEKTRTGFLNREAVSGESDGEANFAQDFCLPRGHPRGQSRLGAPPGLRVLPGAAFFLFSF